MFRHVIWDFDGTLYDTYPAMTEALRMTLKEHGYDAPVAEVHGFMKQSVGIAFEHYAKLVRWSPELEAAYRARRVALEADLSKPYAGIPELLRAIIAAGGRNYIFTHRGASLHGMLKKDGLDTAFVECVNTEYDVPRKPAPDGILYLLDKHGLDPEECIMVGDRELDIQSGINAGIATCAYCDGTGAEITCADFVARSVEEMRRILIG